MTVLNPIDFIESIQKNNFGKYSGIGHCWAFSKDFSSLCPWCGSGALASCSFIDAAARPTEGRTTWPSNFCVKNIIGFSRDGRIARSDPLPRSTFVPGRLVVFSDYINVPLTSINCPVTVLVG